MKWAKAPAGLSALTPGAGRLGAAPDWLKRWARPAYRLLRAGPRDSEREKERDQTIWKHASRYFPSAYREAAVTPPPGVGEH